METFEDTLLEELKFLYAKSLTEVSAFDDEVEGGIDAKKGGIDAKTVLRAHFCVVNFFLREGEGEGVGGFGPKDVGLLVSALNRPHVSFGGVSKWNSVHEKAATLMFGLVMNHPFHDANKRTAYLSTIYYLITNGYTLSVSEKELEDLTVLIASHGLKKFPRFRDLQKITPDPEIEYIAWYLRNGTHRTDRKQYHVTYRELEKLLKKFDVFMENPKNNSIDIMRWEEVPVPRKTIFHRQTTAKEIRRVCSFGFPGWTKVVGKGRISYLRNALGLTPEKGVDSQSFFNGLDDMRVLVDIYEGALRRLAYR